MGKQKVTHKGPMYGVSYPQRGVELFNDPQGHRLITVDIPNGKVIARNKYGEITHLSLEDQVRLRDAVAASVLARELGEKHLTAELTEWLIQADRKADGGG